MGRNKKSVAAVNGASNRLIDVESLTEAELNVLHRHFAKLAAMAKHDRDADRIALGRGGAGASQAEGTGT